jgi:isopentenyl-diphosphate delta-isomerase
VDVGGRFGNEQLILVDECGTPVGTESKQRCHEGEGLLHQAFSVYLFDGHARLLTQQRSLLKPLWPGFWSNSCCSHPRAGEDPGAAARRRVREELGLDTELSPVFTFRYAAPFPPVGWEREVCTVYIGRASEVGEVDFRELSAVRFVEGPELDARLGDEAGPYTPWFRIAWPRLRAEHWEHVLSLAEGSA